MEFASMPSQHFGHFDTAPSSFDMRHMSSALSNYSYSYPQISQAPNVDAQLAYSSFPTQQLMGQMANQFPSQYTQQINPQQRPFSAYSTNLSGTPPEHQHLQNRVYLPQQQTIHHPTMPRPPHYPTFPTQHAGQYGQMPTAPYQARSGMPYQMPRLQVENVRTSPRATPYGQGTQDLRRNSSNSSLQTLSTLRGPPRKPKQSGHALWVGNLPPGTQIIDLKDHFSQDATDDIESVFLISKSNCAFVNYKSEGSCAAAMTRFHDSRFRGARLVCRLRRGSNSAGSPASATAQSDANKGALVDGVDDVEEEAVTTTQSPLASTGGTSVLNQSNLPEKMVKEKFFIVKSLTVEDLERSVTSGIWATQAHNEENLNLAFKTAENVYLVFSANKSGEYFGYARMDSTIGIEAITPKGGDIEPPKPPTTASTSADVPLTIPTPATATAPRGHIIDDSARGTIFWEAENTLLAPSSAVDALSGDSGDASGEDASQSPSGTQQMSFGKPFKITWQSTERLPFYRTRGLRNPWNANREVKIARDGTELEPTVGRKLIGMFEQQAHISAVGRSVGAPAQYGYSQQMQQYPGAVNMPQGYYGYGMQNSGAPYGRPY